MLRASEQERILERHEERMLRYMDKMLRTERHIFLDTLNIFLLANGFEKTRDLRAAENTSCFDEKERL